MTSGSSPDPGSASGPPAAGEIEALVRSLVAIMRGGGMTELDVAFGSVSIRLRGCAAPTLPAEDGAALASESDEARQPVGDILAAPMIGTFYAAPSPGAAPFIEVGDSIAAGQVIGIIEAMKIMNEIPAERGGVVDAVLVANGQPVEFGTPLIRLRPPASRPT